MPMTVSPRSNSLSAVWLPIKPATPVTTMGVFSVASVAVASSDAMVYRCGDGVWGLAVVLLAGLTECNLLAALFELSRERSKL